VAQRDATAVLREERTAGRRHDLILLDPPYDCWAELGPQLAGLLPAVVAEAGIVVVETDARTEPTLPLALVTTRRYGSARLTLFRP
jgi:16S rRNA G966 N2-methylase RsmD